MLQGFFSEALIFEVINIGFTHFIKSDVFIRHDLLFWWRNVIKRGA